MTQPPTEKRWGGVGSKFRAELLLPERTPRRHKKITPCYPFQEEYVLFFFFLGGGGGGFLSNQ